ncbi:MAG: DNA double-strand break repair nuclease NurA [Anaerolineales bacterium]|jgi:hypothetical protein
MSLDFQQVRQQIQEFSKTATESAERLLKLRELAAKLLTENAVNLDYLRDKALQVANLDQYFRVALPTDEALNESFPLPDLPAQATIIAADGSQINPDRHLGIDYCLVNVGAFQMVLNDPNPPKTTIKSELFFGEDVFSMQEKIVALIRDMREREILAELAADIQGPLITFTDGPIELWGREVALAEAEEEEEKNYFERYMKALHKLYQLKAATAGYVDKPRFDLLIRLLEIAPENKPVKDAGKNRWLRGILDTEILEPWIGPGERSAIFGLLSRSTKRYQNQFSLHFFYLNVSLNENKPMLARVEIPAWVAQNAVMVDALHAVLVQQCQIVPTRTYPYVLTRADETAVVSRDEKEQVASLMARELRQRGMEVSDKSQKQLSKEDARY